jgi:hypothetical protein
MGTAVHMGSSLFLKGYFLGIPNFSLKQIFNKKQAGFLGNPAFIGPESEVGRSLSLPFLILLSRNG